MAKQTIADEDRHEAVRRLLVGLTAGHDVHELAAAVADLHPKNDTFPGEVYMRLAADVIAATDDAGAGPIEYEGLRERHLEEVRLRGKENRKFQYAVLCSAAVNGGLEPDLLRAFSAWSVTWRERSNPRTRR